MTNSQYSNGQSTILKFYNQDWIAANCPEFISKDEWPQILHTQIP